VLSSIKLFYSIPRFHGHNAVIGVFEDLIPKTKSAGKLRALILLMVQKSGVHSPVEGKVVYPNIYKVCIHPKGGFLAGFLKHQQ